MGFFMLFLFIMLCSLAVAFIAWAIYAISPYGKMAARPASALRPGERGGLYFAAFYPAASLVAFILITNALHISANRSVMTHLSYFLFFGGQSLLSAYSASVCWYLRKANRAFTTLLVLSLLAGGCYLFMISFAFWIS
jgi:hypothetical protein